MKEKLYKIKLTTEELFLVDELLVRERDRLGPVMRQGVGLQAVSANEQSKRVYAILDKLNEHTKLRLRG